MLSVNRLLTALSLLTVARAIELGPVADIVLSNEFLRPDGLERGTVLAGGTHPGPVIRGKKGDRFQLNVQNNLTNHDMELSSTIHWHGIFQNGTSPEDGAAFVTQCPIIPGHSYLYDFSVPNQAGTYWYHSHMSTQYCDGLRGVFIIEDPNDPYKNSYDFDNEATVISLSDWFHVPARDALNEHAQSTLINGRGRYPGGPVVPLSVVSVQSTKRYRFRLVNMACSAAFTFAIDKHALTIIEADGEYTRPHTVDSLEIFAGQRYSVILTADQAVGNYWLRANPDRGNPGYDGGRNQAILRYIGAPPVDPTTVLNVKNPLKEQNLHALVDARPPGNPWVGGADVNINLVQSFDEDLFRFQINGEVFEPPTVPVLLQILNGTHKPQELLPKGTVIPLPRNKVIEVSMPALPSTRSGPHPFHLHGHAFWVVRSGDNDTYNYVNPVRRDTVSTGLQTAAPNATIRFVTDNAGPWFLHCHIDWHLELGLAVVFAEDIPGIAQTKTTPQWDELCPLYEAWKTEVEGPL